MVTDECRPPGTAVDPGDAQWVRYSASQSRLGSGGRTPPPPMTAEPQVTSARWLDGDGQRELPSSPRADLTRLRERWAELWGGSRALGVPAKVECR